MAHVDKQLKTVSATASPAVSAAPHALRRFAAWLSAMWADDGMNARFAAERQRDEGIVRRVERRRS